MPFLMVFGKLAFKPLFTKQVRRNWLTSLILLSIPFIFFLELMAKEQSHYYLVVCVFPGYQVAESWHAEQGVLHGSIL